MHNQLFEKTYLPRLEKIGVETISFRIYSHEHGRPLKEDDATIVETPLSQSLIKLQQIIVNKRDNESVALTSKIRIKNKTKNLLFLDCAISNKPDIQHNFLDGIYHQQIKVNLKSAVLIETPESFHIACFLPLSENDWLRAMYQTLLERNEKKETIFDIRYIAHSLLRKYGSLRVTENMGKSIPKFITNL